ncbi:hypothetical protein TNCV_4175661 [Trichonephila clavipes]|nr:hypothetical protein TNCV_4175661 [Trichonephila clavipes]
MSRYQRPSFQQDNVRPYTARISLDCIHAINTLPWSASSPDLSPIEYVWDLHQDGRIRVWRYRDERTFEACNHFHHTGPSPGVMA